MAGPADICPAAVTINKHSNVRQPKLDIMIITQWFRLTDSWHVIADNIITVGQAHTMCRKLLSFIIRHHLF